MTGLTINGIRMYDASPDQKPGLQPTLINRYSALSIPAYKRAMRFLSENLASFPRQVHRDGAKPVPGTPRHPLEKLLTRRPNLYQNATTFWRTLFLHAAHAGNGYARIERGDLFRPIALHNWQPEDVWPFRFTREGETSPRQYYLHRPTRTIYDGEDVLHLHVMTYDGMCGTDPVELHETTFQRAATLDRYQTHFLMSGTVIRGTIEIPLSATQEQIDEVRSQVRMQFNGPTPVEDVLILSGGASLKNATLTPQQSQLFEQGTYTTTAIAQITGVPPQFLYHFADSKYNNSIEQMGQDVVRNTFRPWIEQTEDELTQKLLTDDDQDDGFTVRLNPDALLRGDTKTQTDTVLQSVNGGLRTRNEGRKLLDLPPDPDPRSDQLSALGETAPPGKGTVTASAAGRSATYTAGPHEYSTAQVGMPAEVTSRAAILAASIPADELADAGREADIHVTVRYGLHATDARDVAAVAQFQKPVTLTLGKVAVFEASGEKTSDVVMVEVDSPDLVELNRKLAAIPHTDTHPTYKPHMTLAYVKPGVGKKYAGRSDFEGMRVVVDRLTFSDQQNKRSEIPLLGESVT